MTRTTLSAAACLVAVAAAVWSDPAAAQGPAQSFVYRQRQFRHVCRPPLKFAAGACLRRCPAGYRDDGGYCRFLGQRMR